MDDMLHIQPKSVKTAGKWAEPINDNEYIDETAVHHKP